MKIVTSHSSFLQRIAAAWAGLSKSAAWGVVVWPFIVTRLAWVLAAFYARGNFLPNPTYQKYIDQGGQLTRIFLLDIFAHWDAKFYLSIITDGYLASADLAQSYSNIAFFPLYPYLVKSIGWLGVDLPEGVYLLIGLLLSNLCFLGSAALLYGMATTHLGLSELATRRGLLLLYVFPASFYFSSFYPESLFLFLSVLGFAAGMERRWWLAGVAAGLVVLARAQGVVVAAALGLLYLEQRNWRLRAIRADVLWLGLAPLLLAAHLYHLYTITGTFFAPLQAQAAWGRSQYGLFEGLRLQLTGPVLDVYKIDAALVLAFLACGVYLTVRRGSAYPKVLGIFTVLVCLVPISTGLLVSVSRFMATVFPVFLLLGEKLERSSWFDLLCGLWFALQILYFAGWVNYYWIA